MMRGRILALKGIRSEDYPATEDRWVLDGDRGVTYSATIPEGSTITEGTWWEPGHTGSNLVSFDAEVGRNLNLAIGDKLVVNVLGRSLEVTIANFRTVEWRSLGINFVMVFSPNTFSGATYYNARDPHLSEQGRCGAGTRAAQGDGGGLSIRHYRTRARSA